MQDNAFDHATKVTIEKLSKRDIRVIWWLTFNLDLNLIEKIWDEMKNWIQKNYFEQLNYDRFRSVVMTTWDHISIDFLSDLIDSMPDRCQAVIDANDRHTKY